MAEEAIQAEEEAGLTAPPAPDVKCPKAGAPAWMATFADLVTLLMCFFVLLFAMSTTQQETYKELVQSCVQKADYIFHCAALVSVYQSIQDPDLCHAVNYQGTKNILDSLY